MDKKVILAVAGSGKTSYLIKQLNDNGRFLILTYTTGNIENLRNAIIKKFGFVPNNIKVKSYFTFLHSFCYKPFLADDVPSKGIYWKFPPEYTRTLQRSNNDFYLLNNKWLYHNRLAKLIIEKNIIDEVHQRLKKYFDYLYIDEVQDFGGHDFNLLTELSKADIAILFVGDFFQHTFNTSNEGKVNISLHKTEKDYRKRFTSINLSIDNTTLVESYRCSTTVCDFIREKVGINIYSKANTETNLKLITEEAEADAIFRDNTIIKLFLLQHYSYDCYGDNWGNCKGLEYENVCVVINDDTLKLYNNNSLTQLNPTTKNKFYVACTRTKNDLYFVPQKFYKKYKKA